MLIEFSVTNFRSFRERQTLSMVAAPRLRKRENVFKPESAGEKFPDLLKVAVIYGPNASGKSNLLRALNVVMAIAVREPSTRDIPLPVSPFRFDPALADQPSVFELNFIQAGVRYKFYLSATSERIISEKMLAYPKGHEALLYERNYCPGGDYYKFGESLKNLSLSLLDAWKKLTPPKLLFVAQVVANSSETVNSLKAPFEWLQKSSFPLLGGMDLMAKAAQKLIEKNKIVADNISEFLRDVDVPISRMKIKNREISDGDLDYLDDLNSAHGIPGVDIKSIIEEAKKQTILTHRTALGDADLAYEDESEGTRNLIGFWIPWAAKNSSEYDRCLLIVDELDSSLHPKIVAVLVEKHINSKTPSQLIFTTHDTHLMDTKLLRRDQFWITERDMNGATQLRSIHDFEGRESEDIEKRYYEGRYRGLPFVKRSV